MSVQKACAAKLRLLGDATTPAGRDFDLTRDETLLGRDADCAIVLAQNSVARRHARVVRRSDGYYLEDLGSSRGTMLNCNPLVSSACLEDGDRIGIGDYNFTFTSTTAADRPGGAEGASILGLRDLSGTEEHELAGVRPEEKLRALLEVGRDLVGIHDLKGVLTRTLDALFRIFSNADRGFVLLKKEASRGLAPRAIKLRNGGAGRATISRTIFQHVMLHGQAVLSVHVETDDRFSASLSAAEARIRTLMCVPLKDHRNRPVGILQLDTCDWRGRFTPGDLEILVAVASQVSAAVENARLLEVAGRERRRLAFLAKSGAVLASSLDLETTLPAVAHLAVPLLADFCVIDLRDEDGSIRRVAAAHADPTRQGLVDELRRYPPDPEGPHPAMRVLRTNRIELVNSIPGQLLEATTHDAKHQAIVHRLGPKSYLIVPLVARGLTLGVVSLFRTEPGRKYSPAALELAKELARRASQAIDTAALFREAEVARRRAEEAGRSKDLFLAMLSHELRTPLTPILAVASAHLEDGSDSDHRPEWEMIHRNVALEARLIDDLLDLSRIERGRLRLDREMVDVHGMIQQAVEVCRDETSAAGLEVILDLAASGHHVEADEVRLTQIAWNLIRNAVKFTPGGGMLTIRTRNERVDGRRSSPSLIIEFEDTGLGIEPDVMPRFFEAFEQGQSDSRLRSGGLGLGLAISRSLAEAHGGSLTARSPGTGCGSTFRLELTTAHAPASEAEVPTSPVDLPPRRFLRILLVEDNRDTLRFLAQILGQHGHEIRKAATFTEAQAEAAAGAFDLLLSDIELPDGTGLELMREVASLGMTGIAMSGYGSEDDVRQSREAGFAEHLTKPVDISRLEKAIRQATQTLGP